MTKSKKHCKLSHYIIKKIIYYPVKWYLNIFYHYHTKDYIHLKKEENVLILSNHQTDLDPGFISMSFNKPIYFVMTDSVTSNKLAYLVLKTLFNPIPKKKGFSDLNAIKAMLKVNKEKGCLCLFPEGNRSYGDFSFYIGSELIKLIRNLKMTLVLYHLEGGFGVNPRFGKTKRKGKIKGSIPLILKFEEYQEMDDAQLLTLIKDHLAQYDENKALFKSQYQAEYLERLLFVCPTCNTKDKLYSYHQHLYCLSCGTAYRYENNLMITSAAANFSFNHLSSWYAYQKKYLLEYPLNEQIIFSDENNRIYLANPYQKRKLVTKGSITLDRDYLTLGTYLKIKVDDIITASPIVGTRLNIVTTNNTYLIDGNQRFNPVKYVLMLHRLSKKVDLNDNYFRLEE